VPAKTNWKALATEVINSLSQKEREESIAYIEQRVFPSGQEVPWIGIAQYFDEPVVIAFIDLEPALNWTHRGRYLVLGVDGEILRKAEVDRPPFLTGVSPYLCLVHQGRQAPSWAVVTAFEQRLNWTA
jgi:hypothetical protein